MAENFPNLFNGKHSHTSPESTVPNKMNPKKPTLRHIVSKMAKFEDEDKLKRSKRTVTHNRAPIKLSADF